MVGYRRDGGGQGEREQLMTDLLRAVGVAQPGNDYIAAERAGGSSRRGRAEGGAGWAEYTGGVQGGRGGGGGGVMTHP
jgi:hypothetical protein